MSFYHGCCSTGKQRLRSGRFPVKNCCSQGRIACSYMMVSRWPVQDCLTVVLCKDRDLVVGAYSIISKWCLNEYVNLWTEDPDHLLPPLSLSLSCPEFWLLDQSNGPKFKLKIKLKNKYYLLTKSLKIWMWTVRLLNSLLLTTPPTTTIIYDDRRCSDGIHGGRRHNVRWYGRRSTT
jgi:hypothetical protein